MAVPAARALVTITGRLVADPDLRYTESGLPWSRMCVALRGTDGVILQDILAAGEVAEAAMRGARVGVRVRASGRLQGRRWVDGGVGCYDVAIIATAIEFLREVAA
jgi:single-stranded DNA-binding protein